MMRYGGDGDVRLDGSGVGDMDMGVVMVVLVLEWRKWKCSFGVG